MHAIAIIIPCVYNMASREQTNTTVSNRKNKGTSKGCDAKHIEFVGDEKEGDVPELMSPLSIAALLSTAIFIGSILHENDMVPDSFFSDKRNALNQRFVKWSWGWTLCILTPFLLLLSWARHPGQFLPPLRALLRLVALTMAWYFWVEIVMHTVHEWTGKCSIESHGSSRACRRGGGQWDGVDISGHSFLLVLIVLTIQEELAPFWHTHASGGAKFVFPIKGTSKPEEMTEIPIFSSILQLVIYMLAIIITLMQSLSIVMVIATSLYFHVISHKVLGTMIAVMTWYLAYKICFHLKGKFILPLL